jgi:hypothetical protein
MHYAYRDSNGTIWHVVYQSGWKPVVQIKAGGVTNGPAADGDPCLCDFGGATHCAYRSKDTIQDAYWDGNWGVQQINLNGLTSGDKADGDPRLCQFGGQQHFVYRAKTDSTNPSVVWDSYYS